MALICKCEHPLSWHQPRQDAPFAWPCSIAECDCREFNEMEKPEPEPNQCPKCRGTGGGQYNDCPMCDGNGVL